MGSLLADAALAGDCPMVIASTGVPGAGLLPDRGRGVYRGNLESGIAFLVDSGVAVARLAANKDGLHPEPSPPASAEIEPLRPASSSASFACTGEISDANASLGTLCTDFLEESWADLESDRPAFCSGRGGTPLRALK